MTKNDKDGTSEELYIKTGKPGEKNQHQTVYCLNGSPLYRAMWGLRYE